MTWCGLIGSTAWNKITTPSHTQQYKRTSCSSRADTTPVSYIQRAKANAELNKTVQFKRTRSNKNVRTVHPGPTRHPLHTITQRGSTQSRHRHCVYLKSKMAHVGEITYELILQRTLITPSVSNTFKVKLTYSSNTTNVRAIRTVPTRHPPVPCIQHAKIITESSSPLLCIGHHMMRWHYDLIILHGKPIITPSSSSAHAAMHTNVLSVCLGPTRHPFIPYVERTKVNAAPSIGQQNSAWRWD